MVMLINIKLSYGNARFHLATTEYARPDISLVAYVVMHVSVQV